MRSVSWQCGERTVELAGAPLIMGILNVTPDSFSDGGRYVEHAAAVSHALKMVADGADIIDIGGESTRPGAAGIQEDEECARVLPVIEGLRQQSDVLVSVDTMKAGVARRAIEAGANIINDVSALTHDVEMAGIAAATGAGVVLMHMQGRPRTMQRDPHYGDAVSEIRDFLAARMEEVEQRGIARNALAIDPGIGFGKTVEHNLELLAHVAAFAELGCPVLIGISRKSFLGKLTGCPVEDRLSGSLAAMALCVWQGAHIVRVHDVKQSKDAALVAAAIRDMAR